MNEQELEKESKSLNSLLKDPTASIQDVMRLIGQDKALLDKILVMANSARYSSRNRITSLRHAIVLLGFEKIMDLFDTGEQAKKTAAPDLKEQEMEI